jgi:hypothetical protein
LHKSGFQTVRGQFIFTKHAGEKTARILNFFGFDEIGIPEGRWAKLHHSFRAQSCRIVSRRILQVYISIGILPDEPSGSAEAQVGRTA